MPDLKTETLSGVELLSVGRWHGGGCPEQGCEFTAARLDQMVEAYNATKDVFDAPIKLGHDDNQKLLQKDGYPAAGWVTNIRRAGDKLVGDFRDVPARIAELIRAGAYRKRSAEMSENMEVGGRRWPLVFTGIALLGADLPAVEGLSDITALYQTLRIDLGGETHVVMFEAEEPKQALIRELNEWFERARPHFRGRPGSPSLRALHRMLRDGFVRTSKARLSLMAKADGSVTLTSEQVKAIDTYLDAIEDGAEAIGSSADAIETALGIEDEDDPSMRRTFAQWDTAFINNLPDSAFAYIAPGGEKEDGKTTPRTLRYLPHHDPDGAVDEPHLRNALSRAPQTNLPDAARQRAINHLEAHARALGIGDGGQ